MRSREDLAKYFAEQGLNRGVEVGVDEGEYSQVLLAANPNLVLACVDLWERRGGKSEVAKNNLSAYADRVSFYKDSSLNVALSFLGEWDFVYIDAAHDFDNVMLDLILWGKIVRVGGIISGHDYANNRLCGVEDAVNMYAKHHGLEVHVLEEPSEVWTPRYPNENNRPTGLSWWMQK